MGLIVVQERKAFSRCRCCNKNKKETKKEREKRTGVSEDQWSEFHDANESTEVEDLCIRISPIEHAREVEQFCAGVDLFPEPRLEQLFLRSQRCRLLDQIEVGQHTDHFGEPVRLENV